MGTDKELAIVYADVVGSTELYESLGDEEARETIARCVACMKECTAESDGEVIKTMGDEVMSTFDTADQAMSAANQMQLKITNGNLSGKEDVKVSIRIGCDFGEVVVEKRDVTGAAVAAANRMTSQAKAGQIITTKATVDLLSEDWQSMTREVAATSLRGQSEEVAIYEVLWQPGEVSGVLPKIDWGDAQVKGPGRLVLRFQGQEVEMSADGLRKAALGRADENEVTIKCNLISRVHARIELSKSSFMIVDQSTNGTFVQRNDGEEVYVRRDSARLRGSGLIGLGRVAARGTPLAIEYECSD